MLLAIAGVASSVSAKNADKTSTDLSSSANPAVYGQSVTLTATTNSAAGPYPIVVASGTLTLANYNFVFVTGTLTVTNAAKPPVANASLALSPLQANAVVKLNLAGGAGQAYVIEASADLTHWTAISTNLADGNGLASFVDSDAKNYSTRFYRTVPLGQ